MRLSIGLPVYNGERFLRETVEALLAQTFGDFELVIADNASTDRTPEIARELAAADARIQYHRHAHNLGMAGNYNFLARRASAPWFKWATSDDLCDPSFLERCTDALAADPGAVLAYTRVRFIDGNGAPLSGIVDPGYPLDFEPPAERFRYVMSNEHWVNAVLGVIRTKALLATPLMPDYPFGDHVLLGALALQGRFIEIEEPLLRRRLHADASSALHDDIDRVYRYLMGREGVALPTWYRLRDYAKTVLASRLSWRDKLSLLLHVLRVANWRRDVLRRELAIACRLALQPRRARPQG